MTKKWSDNYIQTWCTSSYHENTCVSKQTVQNCKGSYPHKRYPLSIYWGWKMTSFFCCCDLENKVKVTKFYQFFVMSQLNVHENLVRIQPLVHMILCRQESVQNVEKVTKNDLTIISKPHAHPHTCKISKQSVQNCKRSCSHKTPTVNVDR